MSAGVLVSFRAFSIDPVAPVSVEALEVPGALRVTYDARIKGVLTTIREYQRNVRESAPGWTAMLDYDRHAKMYYVIVRPLASAPLALFQRSRRLHAY